MSFPNYRFIHFPSTHFSFLKRILKGHSLILVAKSLSISTVEQGLKQFDATLKKDVLRQFLEEQKIASIGIIKDELILNFEKELELLSQKIDFTKSYFTVLIAHGPSNHFLDKKNLPSEEAFLISPKEFVEFYEKDISTGLCYDFAFKVLEKKTQITQVVVHQTNHPNPVFVSSKSSVESAEIIMPHAGNLKDVDTALWHLSNQKVSPKKVSVCFDEPLTKQHFDLADRHSNTRFFINIPYRIGPYPSRDVLARATEEEVIIFHDSDDVSTTDRVGILTDILKDKNCDVVGSHELRINKIDKIIQAVRFPVDPMSLKDERVNHSIFFPTTAIKKSAFLKTGGLSTIRKHSSDTQFYLRAQFFLNMKTVDEFLYVRIRHENSLTISKSTALGSPVRRRLGEQWINDFFRVKHLNTGLLASSLVDEHNNVEIDLISLEKENRTTILKWQELRQTIKEKNPFRHIEKPDFPNEKEIGKDRIADFQSVTNPGINALKKSFSWKIGWRITRLIIVLFGWVPFVKKRIH